MSGRRALAVLGSNIAPERNLTAAIARLQALAGVEVVAVGGTYESPPFGRPGDPWFQNCAVLLETGLSPEALRSTFRAVEGELGRVRTGDRYAPRPIDIDLVAFEGFAGDVGGKPLPDPDILGRAFLALPLADLAPEWVLPGVGRTLREIAATFDAEREQVRRLPDAGRSPR